MGKQMKLNLRDYFCRVYFCPNRKDIVDTNLEVDLGEYWLCKNLLAVEINSLNIARDYGSLGTIALPQALRQPSTC
jgi:hypothetical protein